MRQTSRICSHSGKWPHIYTLVCIFFPFCVCINSYGALFFGFLSSHEHIPSKKPVVFRSNGTSLVPHSDVDNNNNKDLLVKETSGAPCAVEPSGTVPGEKFSRGWNCCVFPSVKIFKHFVQQ